METIDLTSFENAINSLIEVIDLWNDNQDDILRDSIIQRFEYTYSLALKMIRRYFTESAFAEFDSKEIYGMSFNQMIRTANSMGLLKSNLETWTEYREKRNMTSHTYDENIAQDVVAIIPDFKDEAVFLLNKLKEKIG
ncbi:nucleotidyltransferase substrate binding protein [bacterium]|nr:nucleotidyltransferase substrate binding protein [bacterium]